MFYATKMTILILPTFFLRKDTLKQHQMVSLFYQDPISEPFR